MNIGEAIRINKPCPILMTFDINKKHQQYLRMFKID